MQSKKLCVQHNAVPCGELDLLFSSFDNLAVNSQDNRKWKHVDELTLLNYCHVCEFVEGVVLLKNISVCPQTWLTL